MVKKISIALILCVFVFISAKYYYKPKNASKISSKRRETCIKKIAPTLKNNIMKDSKIKDIDNVADEFCKCSEEKLVRFFENKDLDSFTSMDKALKEVMKENEILKLQEQCLETAVSIVFY
jgi:hypothetical protein